MSSIRDEPIALDSNEYIFAIRRSPDYPACGELVRRKLVGLKVYVPLQVVIELNRNLYPDELRALYRSLRDAKQVIRDLSDPDDALVDHYAQLGAKAGDARICAHLHSAKIGWLVSENRHFLHEIPDKPFGVLTAAELLDRLGEE